MKTLCITIGFLCLSFLMTATAYSQIIDYPRCDALGRINGIYYTNCFLYKEDDPNIPGDQSDGMVSANGVSVRNDTPRLQYAINYTYGKLIFNESNYYINGALNVSGFRTLIGTGRETRINATNPLFYLPSKIVQTANNTAIFKIGQDINDVSIRDLGLTASTEAPGAIGIFAQNGTTEATSGQSLGFDFSDLTFENLDKGIYVNAQAFSTNSPIPGIGAEGGWRFDNVRLEKIRFQNCRIGVHVNSKNSGWSMKNLLLEVPAGPQIPLPVYNPNATPQYSGGITPSNVNTFSIGLYLQRIGYSTIDLAIGDGPHASTGTSASAFIYVGEHANLNIQSSVDEVFKNSIYVYGGDINSPINLSNNIFQSQLIVRNSTIMSSANQFTYFHDSTTAPAKAFQSSKIYSIGDRFCLDYIPANSVCTEPPNAGGISTATYDLDPSSQMMFSSNPYTTTVAALRFGPLNYQYDIVRDNDGILAFNGVQGSGAGGFFYPGYAGYSFKTPGGTVKINYDGSVTYGNKNYNQLITNFGLLAAPGNGTVIYCSDCQKATPCNSGGGGALAKRINGNWDCD